MRRLLYLCAILATCHPAAAEPVELSITAQPYLTGGLFTRPLLPQQSEPVTITVRASCQGAPAGPIIARLTIESPSGKQLVRKDLDLKRTDAMAEATCSWVSQDTGLFKVRVHLDPANKIREKSEANNAAELMLPVIVERRELHFPWYREPEGVRWMTCATSTKGDQQPRLLERGVLPLNWEYGGMSWTYYDKDKAKTDPEAVLTDVEKLFYKKFTREDPKLVGLGMDEFGGYPGTFKHRMSVASLKALARAKKVKPDRFFAAWNGGGLSPELATYYRMGADLLLLETYVFRAVPTGLKTEEIYETIRDRLSPVIRARDMIVPAYGNTCYTLIALDTSERPDWVDLGELENVVRFIRRICPEMRGIAWYNGGYGGYGLKRSEQTDRVKRRVIRYADALCLAYFIKPCLTLMPQSLWLEQAGGDRWQATVALSNIGAIDSGPASVELFIDGTRVGRQSVDRVAAGSNRIENRVLLRYKIKLTPGLHTLEARLVETGDATVLDAVVSTTRVVR